MGIDNLSPRQVNHLKAIHGQLNSFQHRITVKQSNDAKIKFFVKSTYYEKKIRSYRVWDRKKKKMVWVEKVIEIFSLQDPLGQLTRFDSRK